MSTAFIESHPVLAALVVALLFLAAVAFELLSLRQRALAVWTALIGSMGIIACFTGAQQSGLISTLSVGVLLAVFWAGVLICWRKAM